MGEKTGRQSPATSSQSPNGLFTEREIRLISREAHQKFQSTGRRDPRQSSHDTKSRATPQTQPIKQQEFAGRLGLWKLYKQIDNIFPMRGIQGVIIGSKTLQKALDIHLPIQKLFQFGS
jgi:hypothetical protein